MSAQPEALRLAAELEDEHYPWPRFPAADELRRLHADAEESEALRERLSALLRNTAIALRGPEPEMTRWSWHDLPELATALKAQRDALLEALQALYDEQQGPPLIRHQAAWEAAMQKARAALAQQAEPVEPVAWVLDGTSVVEFDRQTYHDGPEWTPLCKCADTPPQRQPLTEEEIERICMTYQSPRQAARAIERAHGIGDNT